MGIRLALGAGPGQILQLIVRDGLELGVVGSAIGWCERTEALSIVVAVRREHAGPRHLCGIHGGAFHRRVRGMLRSWLARCKSRPRDLASQQLSDSTNGLAPSLPIFLDDKYVSVYVARKNSST